MNFDGVLMGNGSNDGVIYEAFDAPWWRLDRWFSWFLLKRKAPRGRVTINLVEQVGARPRYVRVRARHVPGVFIDAQLQERLNALVEPPESLRLPTDR